MHLLAAYKLKNAIKYAVYSTLKSKSTGFYHHLLRFLHSLPFHQLSSHRLNKDNQLMVEPGILLPLLH